MASVVPSDSNQIVVAASPREAQHVLLAELTPWMTQYAKFTLSAQDERTLVYTRRFIPTWAIVLAVIGLLVFLLGLLFLLVKDTQTVTISIGPSPLGEGSLIKVNGAGTSAVPDKIASLLPPAK